MKSQIIAILLLSPALLAAQQPEKQLLYGLLATLKKHAAKF